MGGIRDDCLVNYKASFLCPVMSGPVTYRFGGVGVPEQEVLKLAASQGFFAVLFVALLFYVLRENSKRESSYQDIISMLSNKLEVVKDIQEDVKEIKTKIYS